jgi:molybdopterin-guanine dinucleotide biosynthesis protein A
MAIAQAEKLAFVCGRAALVGKDPTVFEGSGYTFVRDEAEPHAPAFGILAALSFSPEDVNVIVAADVPRFSEAFLAALLEIAEAVPAPVIMPVSGGRPQPLCAVWRRSALRPLTNRVSEGKYSLVEALDELGGVLIPEEETAAMPGGEPRNFFNVNTPEDYESLEDETRPYASRR